MAIFNPMMWLFHEVLALPGFVRDPFLCLGVQSIEQSDVPGVIPDEFKFLTLRDLLLARGLSSIDELDPFDARANLQWNLNEPVPAESHERYATVFDIGCVEHIFDTRMVFENCMRLVAVGGYYAVHTMVGGLPGHGLHTFHPELVPRVMEANGFDTTYLKYTDGAGNIVSADPTRSDMVAWAVAKKTVRLDKFHSPEQARYSSV